MATAAARGVFAALARSDTDSRPDADLLRRFAAARDEAAFAELVRRHGPLVLGVCRRVVPDRHLADDAFQAVFVVLANKAGALDAARPLGPWLYGVAFRVALRARTMIGRRRKWETLAATLPDVTATAGGGEFDLSAVVDEEIARLSAVCREAVVLCEMQGLSRKEAAKRLGVAEGTLSSRLAAARKTLAERLRARGVVLGAGLVSTTFVPTDLLAAAIAVSTEKVELSTQLMTLVQGATHMALLSKLKLAAVAALFVLLASGGIGVWRGSGSTAAPVPKDAPDTGLIWTHNAKTGELTAYTSAGKKTKELALKDGKHFLGFTPDGKQILFVGKGGKLADAGDANGLTLHLRAISDATEGTDTGLDCARSDQFVLSPDGKRIVRQRLDKAGGPGLPNPNHEFTHVLFDVATKKETRIEVPTDCQIMQWAEDGKSWRVLQNNQGTDPKLPYHRWLTATVGDKPKLAPICDAGSFLWLDPHPDGKTFLAGGCEFPTDKPAYHGLLEIDRTTGKLRNLKRFDRANFVVARWSPDGKWIACIKYDWDVAKDRPGGARLLVMGADCKDEAKLLTFADDQNTRLLGWFPTPAKMVAPDPRRKNAPMPKAAPRGG